MVVRPIPHSAEWFAALQSRNPAQAAHTRQIVELAGSAQVCTVCGDTPASDYEITGPALAPDALVTYRLCDDCHAIRVASGEVFIPFGPTN